MSSDDEQHAEQTLAEVNRLRRRVAARAHGGAWVPALTFAVLILASAVLYRHPFGQSISISADYPYWAGLADEQRDPLVSYVFWFLGAPAVFAMIALWYRWRVRRLGMRVAWPVVIGVGAGVFLLLAVLAAAPQGSTPAGAGTDATGLSSDVMSASAFFWAGLLTPLLPVAAAVAALGWAERSRTLIFSALWIAVFALWLCGISPLGSLPGWADWILSGGSGPALGGQLALRPGHYLVVMALPLVIFAATQILRGRTDRRHRVQVPAA